MVITEVGATHVPVEILGFQIKRETSAKMPFMAPAISLVADSKARRERQAAVGLPFSLQPRANLASAREGRSTHCRRRTPPGAGSSIVQRTVISGVSGTV